MMMVNITTAAVGDEEKKQASRARCSARRSISSNVRTGRNGAPRVGWRMQQANSGVIAAAHDTASGGHAHLKD